jgi:hypothetical protein
VRYATEPTAQLRRELSHHRDIPQVLDVTKPAAGSTPTCTGFLAAFVVLMLELPTVLRAAQDYARLHHQRHR